MTHGFGALYYQRVKLIDARSDCYCEDGGVEAIPFEDCSDTSCAVLNNIASPLRGVPKLSSKPSLRPDVLR